MKRRAQMILGGLLSLGFLMASVFVFYVEMRVFSYGTAARRDLYDVVIDRSVRPGLSYYSRKRLMLSCLDGMSPARRASETAERVNQFATRCRDFTMQFLTYAPGDSFAWLINAQANDIFGNRDFLNAGLHLSWVAGPREGWIALQRFLTANRNYSLLDENVRTEASEDIRLLMISSLYTNSLVNRYVWYPEWRPRIIDAVSALPTTDQRRFLWRVRQLGGQ